MIMQSCTKPLMWSQPALEYMHYKQYLMFMKYWNKTWVTGTSVGRVGASVNIMLTLATWPGLLQGSWLTPEQGDIRDLFHKGFMSSKFKSYINTHFFAHAWIMIIRSGHNFAHVMTAKLSWHVQSYDMIELLKWRLEQQEYCWDLTYELINYLWDGSPLHRHVALSEVTCYTPDATCRDASADHCTAYIFIYTGMKRSLYWLLY